MGYPSTVDTGALQPQILYSDDIGHVASAAAVTAGSAFFSEIYLSAPVTVTQMRCSTSGTITGNIDMGIYDSTGTNGGPNNLLGHTGAIAGTTGVFTKNLTANLSLSPGVYWIAFLDTVADSLFLRGTAAGTGTIVAYKTTATNLTVLPATAGALTDDTRRIAVLALLLGGYS